MRNREFYEEELQSLESIDTSPEAIKKIEEDLKQLEDKEKQEGKLDRADKSRLKELRILRGRMERKEELEVLLQMNGIEDFTQEAELPSAQDEALEMVNAMIESNAGRAANEAKGATTIEEGKTLTGKMEQIESVKGYYMTEVPTRLTSKNRVQMRKEQMSKNSVLGASMQLVTLQKLATRTDLSEAQLQMIDKLITYFNKVLDTHAEQDRKFAESIKKAEELEQDAGTEQESKAKEGETRTDQEGVTELEEEEHDHTPANEEKKEEQEETQEEEIDYDNLTAEQKRDFQLKGLQANLDKVIAQLQSLAQERDKYDKLVNESKDPQQKNQAQLMASKIRMQMTPLQNQARDLVQQINNLHGRVEPTQEEQVQESQEEAKKKKEKRENATEHEENSETPVRVAKPNPTRVVRVYDPEEYEEETNKKKNKDDDKNDKDNMITTMFKAIVKLIKALSGRRDDIEALPSGRGPILTTVPKGSTTEKKAEEMAEELSATKEQPQQVEEMAEKIEEQPELAGDASSKKDSEEIGEKQGKADREPTVEEKLDVARRSIAKILYRGEYDNKDWEKDYEKILEENADFKVEDENEHDIGYQLDDSEIDRVQEIRQQIKELEKTPEGQIAAARRSIAKVLYRGDYGNKNWGKEYSDKLKQNPDFRIENENEHDMGYQLDDFEIDRVQEIRQQIKEIEKTQEQGKEEKQTQEEQLPFGALPKEEQERINEATPKIAQEVAESQGQEQRTDQQKGVEK